MLYQMTIRGTHLSQEVNNVYYWHTPAVAGTIASAMDTWGANFKTVVQNITVDEMSYQSIHLRRIDVETPGFEVVPSTWPFAGAASGTPAPPYVAVSIRFFGLNQVYPIRGYKRFAGIPNSAAANGILTATAETEWQTVAGFLDNTFTDSGGAVWTPVLYRAEGTLMNPIAQAVVEPNLTTQNSRKYGRGA